MFSRIPQNIKIAFALGIAFGLTIFLSSTVFLYGTPRINTTYIASFVQKAENLLAGALGRGGNPSVNVIQSAVKQTGAIFMSWYYCPPDGKTCIPDRWYAVPPGANSPYPSGGYYNPDNYFWWYLEASDMTCAGLDIAYVYLWDNPNSNQYTDKIANIGAAINQLQSPLKVAEFWDASYASNDGGPVDLNSMDTAQYRYNKFIKPFYQAIPGSLWATQNGQPILTVYRFGSDTFTNPQNADVFFTNIKNLFKTDFGVEPILILGTEWYEKTSAKNAADGEFDVFNSGITRDGNARTHTVGNLTISNISAGGNDYRSFGSHLDRQDGQVLKNEFSQVPQNANLIMVESWNELGEGSGIERGTYPKSGGGQLPTQTIYMDTLRQLLGKNDRPACANLQNVSPAQPAPTSRPQPTNPVAGTPTPAPKTANVTISVSPQTPSANSSFKVAVSASTGYTWVDLNIFDSSGQNLVWPAPTNGTQPTVTKSGGKYIWTYTVSGVPSGNYLIYFYINCDTVYPHCQQAPFTTPFAQSSLTVQ